MAGLGIDMGFGPNAAAVFGNIEMDGDEYVACRLCGHSGCDLRLSCGCTSHARCLQLNPNGPLSSCPFCSKPVQDVVLFPMSFREIDEAHRTTSVLPPKAQPRGRKRKPEEDMVYISERRTGRWTTEEMAFCDKLMAKFETGELPISDGLKLNEFLGNMLKSKQSRLTKKMKNAKLSSKAFQRSTGCLSLHEGREMSDLEESFFQGITDLQERAEIRFHMQKEWREQFSRVCASVGQPVDADRWLGSVEEMDRRASQTRDAARMARRKLMMGVALQKDSQNPDSGVFIEKTAFDARMSNINAEKDMEEEILNIMNENKMSAGAAPVDLNGKSGLLHSAPFLAKAVNYLQRHGAPFEHIDLWVPSFVPGSEGDASSCRLCFAGSATTEKLVAEDGKNARRLTTEEQFNLFAFGDYSQKFSFDVGCGLPGRVYESGRPTWEQSVQNAPDNHFERCGGALQWGIRTVIGLPIASPNVGRIVVTLYSFFDRHKDEDLVGRLSEEFTRWKLVVDVGEGEEGVSAPAASGSAVSAGVSGLESSEIGKDPIDMGMAASVSTHTAAEGATNVSFNENPAAKDNRIEDIVAMLGEFMPSDPSSPMSPYMQGFVTLRLLLLRQSRTPEEEDLARVMLDSYSSYSTGGRDRSDIAMMLARDCMFMSRTNQPQQSQQQLHPQTQQQQQAPPGMNLGDNMMNGAPQQQQQAGNSAGLSLFGLPSTSLSLQNSPALAPIPLQAPNDTMSIVSS